MATQTMEYPQGGMMPLPGGGANPQDQNQMLMQLFAALLGGGQQQQRGVTPEDLRTATRGRRLNSAGYELAPTEAEQIARDNAAWAARFPKVTDPAIRASQGRTAENQWAALGQDPTSNTQAAAGQTGMTPAQMNMFAGLMQTGAGSPRSIARAQTQQDVGGPLNPNVGQVTAIDPNVYQTGGPYPTTPFEMQIPGTATAANPAGDFWGSAGQMVKPQGKKTKITGPTYPGAARG